MRKITSGTEIEAADKLENTWLVLFRDISKPLEMCTMYLYLKGQKA